MGSEGGFFLKRFMSVQRTGTADDLWISEWISARPSGEKLGQYRSGHWEVADGVTIILFNINNIVVLLVNFVIL